jgi:hypothetical protein
MSAVVRLSPSSTSPSQKLPPSTIYVSELLRTWETAVLLFLNKQIKDKTLTLYISPFLREIGSLPSDEPRYLQGQLNEFIRFLVFLARLVKKSKEPSSEMPLYFKNIPDTFIISFLHFAGPFNDEFLAGIHRQVPFIKSTLDATKGAINITCDTTKSGELKLPAGTDILGAVKYMQEKINNPPQEKFANINGTNKDNTYMPYDAPQLKFPDTTKGLDVNKYIEDFNVPDTAELLTPQEIEKEKKKPKFNKTSEPPSIANFVQWRGTLQNPPDNGATTVYFVSHSGTMKSFVKDVIKSSPPPLFGSKFNKVFERAQKTNTWSVFFKESQDGLEFNGVRHAESCDNRYKEKGRLKHLERVNAGEYTNLALWGILSTLTFATEKVPELIKAAAFTQPGLKICYGMNKESKEFLSDAYDGVNLVCGLKDARLATGNFMVDFGNCGTSQFGTVTMDKDCIKLTSKASNRKVVLYLDIDATVSPSRYIIQVRFFNDANSNTYVEDPPNPSNIPAIANFLSGEPFIDHTHASDSNGGKPIMELPPAKLLELLKSAPSVEKTKCITLIENTSELAEAISTFIASDKFNMKLDKDKGIHRDGHRPQVWADTFKTFNENLQKWKSDNSNLLGVIAGGTNKKLRKHTNYKTMRKYIRKGRFGNKTKHNHHRNI